MRRKVDVIPQTIALSYSPTRGIYDNELHFLFRGTDAETLYKVFTKFCAGEYRAATDFEILKEEDAKFINGHSTHRFAVRMIDPDYNFMNADTMMVLISAIFHNTIPCTVEIMDIVHFLNV
jgi:hypothetical protein